MVKMMEGTWVDVGDGDVINIDSHIDHLTGKDPIDMSDDKTLKRFNWAVTMLLKELKRRVEEDGGEDER